MVIGLGRVGFSYSTERTFASSHVGAFLSNPKIQTLVVVDSDYRKCQSVLKYLDENGSLIHSGQLVLTGQDYVKAVQEFQPNIVSIATNTASHKEILIDLIHPKGPEVICVEKPLADSVDDAEQMCNRWAYIYGLTERKKPRVAVNFSRRWHRNWQRVKEILDSGRIGKPLLAVGHHPGPLVRSGIHMLDLFNWYFGEVDKVCAGQPQPSWMTKKYPETDDFAYNANLTYKNGAAAYLSAAELSSTDYQLFELEIFGEKGAIRMFDNGGLFVEQELEKRKAYGGLDALSMNPMFDNRYVDEYPNYMASMVEDLVQAAQGSKNYPQCTLDDGLRAQYLVSMITQSKGRWLTADDIDRKARVKSL